MTLRYLPYTIVDIKAKIISNDKIQLDLYFSIKEKLHNDLFDIFIPIIYKNLK